MDISEIVRKMTLEDKIRLCEGADLWHSKAMERYGIPALTVADGPHGLRCQRSEADIPVINDSLPATCFPTAVTAAAAWNPSLSAAIGEAIGREAAACGVDVVLGPGCNIKRNPLCGRNFEYFSEDPYLAGKLAASWIQGLRKGGAAASLKHFAANNQEFKRQNGDSQVDERALREIYLAPFEIAVKEGKPETVMCAYNKLNGVYCSDNRWLLTDVLRRDWGFDGLVVTDWSALSDRIAAFQAGCDLNMPGGSRYMEKAALTAVRSGQLSEGDVDAAVERVLCLAASASAREKKGKAVSTAVHDALARTAAEQGAVLLKNEDHLLPAAAGDIVLIGYLAEHFRCQGAGSSHVNPTRLSSLTGALPEAPYLPCCDENGGVTEAGLAEAAGLAKQGRVAVVVAGLPDSFEAESFDRKHMGMPEGHCRMIEAVSAANPNTVVVLLGGSPMELPWLNQVKAVLYMGLSGQAGATACAKLLTGRSNPCGKLAETWPLRYEDAASAETFGRKNPEYRESIYVGYRYYDKAGKDVAFPFGHGLSYTDFAYSDLHVRGSVVTAVITNTGSRFGAEVVQFYVAPPQNGIHRPLRELKGFCRVELAPGQSREVTFQLDTRSFALWDGSWRVPEGSYELQLGSSSRDIRLRRALVVNGESLPTPAWQAGSWYETMKGLPAREEWEQAMGRRVPVTPEPEKGRFTMDSSCLEMLDSSWIMKLQFKVTEMIIARSFGGKTDYSDPSFKMMMTCAVDAPLRSVVISAGGRLPERLMEGLLEMANGRWLRGLARMLRG